MTTAILPVKNETDASMNRFTKDGRELTYGILYFYLLLTRPVNMAQKSKSSNSRKGPEHADLEQNVRAADSLFTSSLY